MIPLDIFPTGWFQVGWSGEIAPGAVKPLKYFDQELVAFRSDDGRLAVLDAHCHHLGAHLGYGGKVKDDCVVCPYHGWEWNLEGENTRIPYQDTPVRKTLRKWPTVEQHGMAFVWYDPVGGEPRWPVPDVFKDFPGIPASEDDHYPCYPHAIVNKPDEPFPVQFAMENAADTAHFKYSHGTPIQPDLLDFGVRDANLWFALMGFKSPKTGEVAMKVHSLKPNVGLAYTVFGGREPYRLILSSTPIDHETSHMRVNYFLRRDAKAPQMIPQSLLDFAAHADELYEQDARIWRHQRFIQRPVFAAQDVAGYTAFRRWSEQFYEGRPGEPQRERSA